MLPILVQQSRTAAARIARSATPDAPVVPYVASTPSTRTPSALRAHAAAVLRRSAERQAPVAR